MHYKPLRQVGVERKAYRRMHTPHHRLRHHYGRCLRRDSSVTHRIHPGLEYVAGGAREPEHPNELGCIVQSRATHLCHTSRSRSYRAGHRHSVLRARPLQMLLTQQLHKALPACYIASFLSSHNPVRDVFPAPLCRRSRDCGCMAYLDISLPGKSAGRQPDDSPAKRKGPLIRTESADDDPSSCMNVDRRLCDLVTRQAQAK